MCITGAAIQGDSPYFHFLPIDGFYKTGKTSKLVVTYETHFDVVLYHLHFPLSLRF